MVNNDTHERHRGPTHLDTILSCLPVANRRCPQPPPRPTIDYEPRSANQMRTRPSNALKATFSAELVAKGWPRNGANQTIPQNLPKHISIQAIIPTSDRDLARRDQMASPSTLDYATIRLKSERALWSQWRLERHRGPTHLETIPCLFTGREQAMSQPPTRQHR